MKLRPNSGLLIRCWFATSRFLYSLSLSHTHTHIYIYIVVYTRVPYVYTHTQTYTVSVSQGDTLGGVADSMPHVSLRPQEVC